MKQKIKTYQFKEGLPQEFEIVDIAELYKNFKDSLIKTHRTGFYHIIWFQKGSSTHFVDFNPIKTESETLLFLSKNIVQRFAPESSPEGKVILFTDHFFCRTESDARFLQNSTLFNDLFSVSKIHIEKQSEHFSFILKQMIDELQNVRDHFQTDILKNLLHNFLLFSERESRSQNSAELKKDANLDVVMRFKHLLEVHYKSKKQVNFYAGEMTVSEKKLNQITTKIFGKSPKEIINERVMLEAKRILAHTSESVKEICYHLGFEEPTNFIKYFKKHSGITPTDFRERNTFA